MTSESPEYDPFARGRFPVGVRTIQARDTTRDRLFSAEIWYPTAAQGGSYPLVLYSHHSGGSRRSATFLCTHLSSHGYIVAALDHSETFAPELARKDGETVEQRAARAEAMVASRVPDVRFLLDHLLNGDEWESDAGIDPNQIGLVGHSFGGWTVLAVPEVDRRVRAVVALAPGGNSNPRPGILRATLTFDWGRDVPTLYLVAENDTPLPLDGMYELFGRTRATKRLVILRRADHLHFIDQVEQEHEKVRAMPMSGELAYIPKEMRPIGELSSGEQAHLFVRGLAVCHFDATLKGREEAKQVLSGDLETELARRSVDVIVYKG